LAGGLGAVAAIASASPAAAETPLSAPALPGAPTGVSAQSEPQAALVSFTAPSSNGSTISSYTVSATDESNPANGGQTASGSASPIVVNGLTDGDAYTFTVTATSAVGTGPASQPSNAVIPIPTITSVSGSAFGLESVGVLPINPTPFVNLPSTGTGGGPFTGSSAPIGIAGVLSTGALNVSTEGAGVGTGGGNSASEAQVADVDLGAGALTIGAVTSTCTSSASGSTGSVTVADLEVDGDTTNIPSDVPPNTTISVPGVASVTLNAQSRVDQPGVGTAITVGGIVITLLGQTATITLAEANCDAEGAAIEVSPSVFGLTPNLGPTAGGTSVTITGSGFADARGVNFGTNAATSFTVVSPTEIVAVSPPGQPGPVNVTVLNAFGTSVTTPLDVFTYFPPPQLASLNPNQGPTTGGQSVTISGTGLAGGQVTIGGNSVSATCTADACTFTTPPGEPGPVQVTVTTPGGGSNSLTYTYVSAPTITSINPDAGPTAGGQTVTITGTGLTGGQVTVGGTPVAATCTADSCTFVTPPGTPGTAPVVVTTPGGSASGPYTYIPAPAISSLKPDQGPTAGGQSVTITGSNFSGGTVAIGGTTVTATCTANSCTFITPPGPAGPVKVTVTTTGGLSSATYTYIPPPAIESLNPNKGPTSGGQSVTISGSNLTGGKVTIGGTPVTATCTADSCTFTTPPHAAGPVSVVVTTPSGTSSGLPYTYVRVAVLRPTVTAVNPAKGPSYGGTEVAVTGTGFSTAAGKTTITFGGVDATNVSCSSSKRCRVTTPVGLGTVYVQATVNGLTSAPNLSARFMYLAGYYLLSSGGTVYPFGFATNHGSVPPSELTSPTVSIAFDPATHGYWVAEKSGKVIGFDAPVLPEALRHPAPSDIVAISSTASGNGYWLVSATGQVYPFGAAGYFGEVTTALNKPAVGISPTPDGGGYFVLAGDGGIFTYGDAHFYGSTGEIQITSPVVAMAVDRHTGGYWIVTADGAAYAFNAPYLGDMVGTHLNRPMLGVVGIPNGEGYYLVAADGGVFAFGQATFFGSLGNERLSDIVSMAFED
jgi:hypothetical protein